MVRIAIASQTGRSHAVRDMVCQDAIAWQAVPRETATVVLACADGLGSAPHSECGSQAAVAAAIRHVAEACGANPSTWSTTLSGAADVALDAVVASACAKGLTLQDCATTLQVLLVSQDAFDYLRIGDGTAILAYGADVRIVGDPPTEEFCNLTEYLRPGAQRHVAHDEHCSLTGAAIFTDGLVPVALRVAEWEPFPGFWLPLLDYLRLTDTDTVSAELQALLAGDVVGSRTDDDCTIGVVAWD